MAEISDRLSIALKRSGLSRQQCVDRFGWNPNSFKSHLNGNANPSARMVEDYAQRFRVNFDWLYFGRGQMEPSATGKEAARAVPIISWVAAGSPSAFADAILDDDALMLTGLPPGDYFATTVRGDSMDRMTPDGSMIVVNCADRDLIRGKPYLFRNSGEATFKLWEPEPVPHLLPASVNPSHKPIFIGKGQDWQVVGRVYMAITNLT